MTALTVKAWRQPAWTATRADSGLGMYVVEAMLRLGSEEYEQTDWALATLRQLRPDLDEKQISERIERLLDLAGEVSDAEQHGPYERFVCAHGEYLDALAELAGGRR